MTTTIELTESPIEVKQFETLYEKDAHGKVRSWSLKVEKYLEFSEIVIIYGYKRLIEQRRRLNLGKNLPTDQIKLAFSVISLARDGISAQAPDNVKIRLELLNNSGANPPKAYVSGLIIAVLHTLWYTLAGHTPLHPQTPKGESTSLNNHLFLMPACIDANSMCRGNF